MVVLPTAQVAAVLQPELTAHGSRSRGTKKRLLIWNQHYLLRALREFEEFYDEHRPHQGIANARPLRQLPPPITDRGEITVWTYEDANV